MNTQNAIRETMRLSGHGQMKTSKLLGKNNNYVAGILVRGSTPRADTLAKIAKVNGFNLALLPDSLPLPDGAILIDSD